MSKFALLAVILAAITTLSPVLGALQLLILYEKPGQQGEYIFVTTKNPELTLPWKTVGSYCVIGMWQLYDLPNFRQYKYAPIREATKEKCFDLLIPRYGFPKSARYLGPEDTSTSAITFLEFDDNLYTYLREVLVTEIAASWKFTENYRFVEIYSFGNSSWTFFSGENFDGNSTCFEPGKPDQQSVFTGLMETGRTFPVHSVVRGCEPTEVAANIQTFQKNRQN